jgi:flagellar biosynthesis protein FlhF
MRLKSFYAKTMTEAMQMVRDTLGEDAVIVATREENGGKAVRVTAAIDPNDYDERREFSDGGRHTRKTEPAFEVAGASTRGESAAADDWLQYDDEEDRESALSEEITDAMLHHNVPEDVMDHILSCASVIGLEDSSVALIAAIEHLFHFVPLLKKNTQKPILLVGPPGAGKTLATAKLATRATMSGLNVGVISADTVRAGGVEQLKAFTDLLGVNLLTASSPQNLQMAVKKFTGFDQIIIDTPGINPFNKEDIRMLAGLIKAADSSVTMVLPAGGDSTESGEMARAFAAMGAQYLLPTRIDMARRIGGVLAAAHYGGLKFTDGSNSPKVSGGIFSLNPKILAKIVMPHAYKDNDHERPLRRTAGD